MAKEEQVKNKSTEVDKPVDNSEKENQVVVNKQDWDKMLRDIENLKKGRTDEGLEEVDLESPSIEVRFIGDDPIVNIGSVYTEENKKGENIEFIDVFLHGDEETPVKVKYQDFVFKMNKKKFKVEKMEVKEKKLHQNNQYTIKKEVDQHRTIETGVRVPVVVKSVERFFQINVDGKGMVQLNEAAVN